MKTVVRKTKTMGRGVFANRDFKKGQIVEVSHCILLDKSNNAILVNSELNYYGFRNDDDPWGTTAIALGHGSLFNHASKKANVTYKYNSKLNVVVFRARKDIPRGAQLFIDYGYDPVEERKIREEKKRKEWDQTIKYRNFELTPSPSSNDSADPCLQNTPIELRLLEK